jgi:hypothetical protein
VAQFSPGADTPDIRCRDVRSLVHGGRSASGLDARSEGQTALAGRADVHGPRAVVHRLTGSKIGGRPLLYQSTVGAKIGQRRFQGSSTAAF